VFPGDTMNFIRTHYLEETRTLMCYSIEMCSAHEPRVLGRSVLQARTADFTLRRL
jgi:hypothetical protein